MTHQQLESRSAWGRFWDRGGWWKALVLAAVYWGLYELAGLAIGALFGHLVDENVYANAQSVLITLAAPIVVAGLLLLLFAWSLGWLKELFGRQPIRGSWWMWAIVIVLVIFNILRFVSVDYAAWDAGAVVAVLVAGLCIGFTEELATRGFAVDLLRRGGYGERSVMLLSSLIFGLLHSGNILSGQPPLVVALTVGYAFAFGVIMYVTLRVTGNLIWPILLHASTDPSLILLSGGIDTAADSSLHPGPLVGIANLENGAVVVMAVIAIIFVRGRIDRTDVYGLREPERALA
ncbi:CPBP family intramembrane glutamic endopeptidase [Agromyces subbeticus]|uniref:CPBP family intramembrane glutamic endopeptidase n=1 Tax=Agromyces subbeticus TaxID=293890 RepID=UPI0003B43294|nr:CPBP family intramembrane glutamic endopeptidase [Agromyces subbeticus]